MITSRMTNRRLVRPSVSSLAATTVHPGPRRRSQSSSAARTRAASGCATIVCLRRGRQAPIDLVEREAVRAGPLRELGDRPLGDETPAREDADAVAQLLDLG